MLPTGTIIDELTDEMDRAQQLHGPMPTDIIHAGAIVAEECGELVKAINDYKYHGGTMADCRTEALHTAATAIRLIEALDGHRTV